MSTTPPQFATAEYKGSGDTCKACKGPIAGEYFRVNGIQACAPCTEKVKQQSPKDSHSAFMRGLLFGVGGLLAGLIVYSAFGIITGLAIGYVSLAVGWLVGKAIKLGSKGVGGLRYQILALAFTYAAVSLSAIPIGIAEYVKVKEKRKNEVVTSTPAPAQDAQSGTDASSTSASSAATTNTNESSQAHMGFGAAVGMLLLEGLASPFLELGNEPSGIIGLVILFVGMRIAWQLTAGVKLEIDGPFKASEPAPATP